MSSIEPDNDLFNNPMTRAAVAAMSDEEKHRYAEIGKELYGHMNFEDAKVLNNTPAPMAEAAAYVESQLQAGLHPSMMEDNEKALMVDLYGEEWYKKWGYVEGDLTDIITVVKN